MNNGIPWWWTYRASAPDARPLPLLDPQAALWNSVQPARALGCVVYSANEVVQPGVVRHVANNQWLLGEPDNTRSARLLAAVELLRRAGLQAEASEDIRHWVWTDRKSVVEGKSVSVCVDLGGHGIIKKQ